MYHGSSQKRDNTDFQTGVGFQKCEAGGFFLKEIMKRLSQQKYDENQEQEYLDKKQRKEEDTRRGKW